MISVTRAIVVLLLSAAHALADTPSLKLPFGYSWSVSAEDLIYQFTTKNIVVSDDDDDGGITMFIVPDDSKVFPKSTERADFTFTSDLQLKSMAWDGLPTEDDACGLETRKSFMAIWNSISESNGRGGSSQDNLDAIKMNDEDFCKFWKKESTKGVIVSWDPESPVNASLIMTKAGSGGFIFYIIQRDVKAAKIGVTTTDEASKFSTGN